MVPNIVLDSVDAELFTQSLNYKLNQEQYYTNNQKDIQEICCQPLAAIVTVVTINANRIKRWTDRRYHSAIRVMGNLASYAFAYW